MAGFWSELISVIDERIRSQMRTATRMGTVTSQAVAGVSPPMVLLDGDTVSVPVKQFAHVTAAENARVGLVRFGSDWVIVGSYS